MCGSIWRAHIDWGDLLPRRPDTPDGPHQGGLDSSLSLSLAHFHFDSPSILSMDPSTSLSHVPFSHSPIVYIALSPSSTPLTYLLKDIWLPLNCLALPLCLPVSPHSPYFPCCVESSCLWASQLVTGCSRGIVLPCYVTLVLLLMDQELARCTSCVKL